MANARGKVGIRNGAFFGVRKTRVSNKILKPVYKHDIEEVVIKVKMTFSRLGCTSTVLYKRRIDPSLES